MPALESAAEAGQILWFFDGLDEVPTESLRAYVRSLVEALLKRYPRARYVLASRIAAYQDPRWKLPGIPIFTLARLDQPKQHFFIDAWFKAHHDHCGMDRVIADGKAARLKSALSDPRRRELREMAGEPMLMTLMALLQTDHRELPQGRAELYEQAVDLFVKRWDSRSDGLTGRRWPNCLRKSVPTKRSSSASFGIWRSMLNARNSKTASSPVATAKISDASI